jgi:NAD(P)-dependent dehydrogenase (short-subunit alcohol dehydrogenase family)
MRAAAFKASQLAGAAARSVLPASSLCNASLLSIAQVQQSGSFSSSAASSKEGPVYIVFGATGGIGAALSQRLAAQANSKSGVSAAPSALILSAQHDNQLKQLQQRIHQGGLNVDVAAADATKPEEVDRVIESVISDHGRLDGVVNCVGNVVARSTLATDLQQLQEELEVNLYSSFNIIKSSVKAMVAEEVQQQENTSASKPHTGAGHKAAGAGAGGSIVLVSAALASHGLPNFEAMSAAKAGVEGLARSTAASYARHNIRVNCVAPGLTRTPQTVKFTDNNKVAGASEQMHPLKDLATPEQVASALAFFLAPENSFITGQVLAVDGGLSTLHPHHAQEYGV